MADEKNKQDKSRFQFPDEGFVITKKKEEPKKKDDK